MVVEASLLLRDLALQDPSEEFDGMPGEGQEPWIFLAHSAHQQIHGGSAAGLWAARICIHLGKHPFSLEKIKKTTIKNNVNFYMIIPDPSRVYQTPSDLTRLYHILPDSNRSYQTLLAPTSSQVHIQLERSSNRKHGSTPVTSPRLNLCLPVQCNRACLHGCDTRLLKNSQVVLRQPFQFICVHLHSSF